MSNLDFILETLSSPLEPAEGAPAVSGKSLMESLADEVALFNERVPEELKVLEGTAKLIIKRESDNGHPRALRAVMQYLSTVENPETNTPTVHRDLLPKNHPLSTRWLSKFEARREVASYFSSDMRIKDSEVRALVASALTYEPDSAQRFFFTEVLIAKTKNTGLLAIIEKADKIISEREGEDNG
jgi:hypothetical protein